jgi:glutamine synthetase
MHGGDRNRTSPFAFTGNKFEFRALGSSQSLSLPNTVLNTITAQAIDVLAAALEARLAAGVELEAAVREVLQASYANNKRIVFEGDNYSDEWHAEAAERGLLNDRTTVDALPHLISADTVEAFDTYEVLSERELHSRYDVMVEQYVIRANIEAETAAVIARTMILPAAVRHLETLRAAGVDSLSTELSDLVDSFVGAISKLEGANATHQGEEGSLDHARYMRDTVLPAMVGVREVADQLEGIVPDDLWPLPKYAEILFIK